MNKKNKLSNTFYRQDVFFRKNAFKPKELNALAEISRTMCIVNDKGEPVEDTGYKYINILGIVANVIKYKAYKVGYIDFLNWLDQWKLSYTIITIMKQEIRESIKENYGYMGSEDSNIFIQLTKLENTLLNCRTFNKLKYRINREQI